MSADLKRHVNPSNKKRAHVVEPQDIADYGDRKRTISRNQGVSSLRVRLIGAFCDFRGCGRIRARHRASLRRRRLRSCTRVNLTNEQADVKSDMCCEYSVRCLHS